MLEDALQNRHHILLFIQFDVLQKKSVEEAYENFCNVLGENVMSYNDFDFWFYHFLNGNFDLDYDRSTAAKSLELTDLPIDAVVKIVEKLSWKEKCIFRNVSQKCREVVDNKPIIIENLYLSDCNKEICLRFDRQSYKYSVNKLKEIVLMENDTEVTTCQKENKEKVDFEVEERKECEKRAVQMLSIALNNPKVQITELYFFMKEQTLVDKLDALFKSLNHQLHVEYFEYNDRHEPYLKFPKEINSKKFLPHFKAGILECIQVYDPTEVNTDFDSNLEKIAELEQWKQAKQFYTANRISDNIDKVTHFDTLVASLDNDSYLEYLVRFKNIYLNSPTFERCDLYVYDMDEEKIREELGGDRFPMVDGSTFHVDVSRSEVQFYKR